ncbi:MAG: alpha-glucan family phosphorylase [Verrucomicrobia bacterium]|nr:alpha-glucan family phosphorylase [Verrucomicrobiota bacterium]
MKHVQLFNIAPSVPADIRFLEVLAQNPWWSWNQSAKDIFHRVHPQLWESSGNNPLQFLAVVPQERFEVLAKDKAFKAQLNKVQETFERTVNPGSPELATIDHQRSIAYFSLEYGIHESLRIYSGGLGVLAGDHLKAASDLDLPLLAIGLFYRQGYFQQYLNSDGWQQQRYDESLVDMMPISRVRDANDDELIIEVKLPEGPLKAVVWRLDVGRVPLFLLDANVPENPAEFREITAQLYGGDKLNRLRQEILLGIGGFRAIIAMGFDPKVCHLNEGHAGFTSLARISHLMRTTQQPLDVVLEIVTRSSVFTTHTPVPAGNETFAIDLVKRHLEVLKDEFGLSTEQVLGWGKADPNDKNQEFSMTIFALRMANRANGVSELHGKVARGMWRHLWDGRPEDEVPIRHVTNGVHVSSWVASDLAALYERYLGPQWRERSNDDDVLSHVTEIPDGELWRAHELGRARLIIEARRLAEKQGMGRNASRLEIERARSVLDPDALTIGFARRFATYKRATLILRDAERLEAMLTDPNRPVQLIVAGKAHPHDDHGKAFIREIVEFSKRPSVAGRILFLENYDIAVARSMVQGVDVWLNNPRRPQEASGTSGMKACMNGGIHVSTLDGWWCEGYSEACGWAIGRGEEYEDYEYQDAVEAQALYNLMENELIPAFYDDRKNGVPAKWIAMMKASIQMALGLFPSRRMLTEYNTNYYRPASADYDRLIADGAVVASQLLNHHGRLETHWKQLRVGAPTADVDLANVHAGDRFTVTANVFLDGLSPDEVIVQVYYGPVSSTNDITESHLATMTAAEDKGNGAYVYRQELSCLIAGRYGFTARVVPAGADWAAVIPGYMTWADDTP